MSRVTLLSVWFQFNDNWSVTFVTSYALCTMCTRDQMELKGLTDLLILTYLYILSFLCIDNQNEEASVVEIFSSGVTYYWLSIVVYQSVF